MAKEGKNLEKRTSDLISAMRERGKKDLYFLAKEILGYNMMNSRFHGRLCDWLRTDLTENKMIMQFRGSFKSTLVTVCENIQDILNNPDITILIQQSTDENACAHLKEITSHFEENLLFRTVYPEFCLPEGQRLGNQFAITVPNRTKKFLPQATVEAAGVTTRLTSRHYTKIVCDDIVDEKTVTNPEQIENALERYKMLRSLLMPNGWRRIVGTRYDYEDVHGWILKNHKDKYNIYHQPAIDMQTGKPTFPELYGEKILQDILSEQGSYIYGCQYLLEPSPKTEQQFKKEWFRYTTEEEMEQTYGNSMQHYIGVDWAASENKKADKTAIVVIGLTPHKDIYIKETIIKRMTPYDSIEVLMRLCMEYQPMAVGMETNACLGFAKEFYQYKMAQSDTYFTIKPIHQTKSKFQRILLSLQPLYQNNTSKVGRTIYHMTHMHEMKLEEQLLRFGRTSDDDLVDALEMAVQIAEAPASTAKREYPWGSFEARKQRLKPIMDAMNKKPEQKRMIGYRLCQN